MVTNQTITKETLNEFTKYTKEYVERAKQIVSRRNEKPKPIIGWKAQAKNFVDQYEVKYIRTGSMKPLIHIMALVTISGILTKYVGSIRPAKEYIEKHKNDEAVVAVHH